MKIVSFSTFCMICLIVCLTVQGIRAQTLDIDQIMQSVSEYEVLFTEDGDHSLLQVELIRLRPLLPEPMLELVDTNHSVAIDSNVRNSVMSWWRSQDPLPASQVNERMIEHVRRVKYALEKYECLSCDTGYDDRGEIYVRYGEPERITEITFDDPILIDAVFQPGVSVSPSDFPDNEFWRYLNIDRDAYFIFVQKQNRYQRGNTTDLIPYALRATIGQGGRGHVKSTMLLAVMRSIYEQLALEHPNFGQRYADVDQWWFAHHETGRLRNRDPLENARIITGGRVFSEAPESDTEDLGQDLSRPTPIYAQGIISDSDLQDQMASYQLEQTIPSSTSGVLSVMAPFSVSMRHARFLRSDGTTSTEVYWHPDPGSYTVPIDVISKEYLIHTYLAHQNSSYETLKSVAKALRVQLDPFDEATTIPVQTIAIDQSNNNYHLAIQWDQIEVLPDSSRGQHQVTSIRIDSLTALDGSGIRLEMSDLKPIISKGINDSFPWPHSWIHHQMNFGLVFEIYHLTYGPGDVTSYNITYDVSRKRGRSSSTTVEFEGESRMVQEEILLELGQRTGEIEITVTVKDLVSENEVSRNLTFLLVDDEG